MAARQDQTLQIFLIVFIFLFLVSAVVAYLGWKGYGEAEQRATSLDTEVKNKSTQATNLQIENEDYREMMGFGRNDNAEDVKKTFETDMKTFGAGVADEASRFYRKVLEAVDAERQRTAEREATLKDDLKDLDNTLKAKVAEHAAQIAQFQKAAKDAEADAAAQRNSFAEDRKKLEDTKAELQKNLDEQRTNYEKQITDRDTKIAAFTKEVDKLTTANRNLIDQRKDEPGTFEIADGRISWVNQNGTVWINLGKADSLRRQVTFSVYDSDQHDAAKAEKKGSIEVTRLLGEHMAEARITEDDATNPILTGDQIYSQVWHRGKKLRFALTGIIDFDNDGQTDVQLARDLIDLNGGIVDAYVMDDGKMEGEITANTRYLLLGEYPNSATQAAFEASWQQMNKEAASLGVETITMNEFLSQMGYRPQDRTVQLGAGATARDFPAKPEDGTSPANSTRQFRPRTPVRVPEVTPQ